MLFRTYKYNTNDPDIFNLDCYHFAAFEMNEGWCMKAEEYWFLYSDGQNAFSREGEKESNDYVLAVKSNVM